MQEEIRLPVRELVAFLLRGGSIDNRLGGVDRALEGGRIHRRLQKAAGDGYRAEVSLSLTVGLDGLTVSVEGRADGLFYPPEAGDSHALWSQAPAEGDCDGPPPLVVDEIKTTLLPFDQLTEAFNPSHWAQALCYAHICAEKEELPQVGVRLTYFQAETEEIRYYRRRFSRDFLAGFFARILEKYKKWADWQTGWNHRRDEAARALSFPFPHYRPGQREMAAAVYRAIRDGGRVFCQAPTGIGKSMSALFPAVKAIGEGACEKIFYLTAKTVARQSAVQALERLRERGAALKSVNLTAKDKICFLEERNCNPEACPYADGHFDRINDALFDTLNQADAFSREGIEAAARVHRVCPYELSLDLALFCDCIVCDYNYLFDPEAKLQRFFGGEGGDYALLIDEAHNLVDRARSMYSASLRKSDFLRLKKAVGKDAPRLAAALQRVNRAHLELRKTCLAEDERAYKRIPSKERQGEGGVFISPALPEALVREVGGFAAVCEGWLSDRSGPSPPWERELLELYFAALSFQRTAGLFDDAYLCAIFTGRRDTVCRLFCMNPSRLAAACMDKGKGAVLFSATLTPMEYFQSLLGGEDAGRLTLPSPFPPERLGLFAASRISTRYKDRENSRAETVELIRRFVSARKGNYMVYFPSYAYLQEVYQAFREVCPEIETIVQQTYMDEAAREAFLARFSEESEGTLAGFCVLGGLFAEGVDLKGDRLIGAVIVGVGLPQVNPEQEILRDYFDREKRGFAYAYRYPGMHKVLQAAGRVIRDEGDRGAVLLIDDRFAAGAYRRLYPAHWSRLRYVRDGEELTDALTEFWSE
ncbi:MAG: ATP-dependent DNA helicase [Clostridiales bacterium]|nr:ATP-dependent DNA helicase [Clostridiales bacterium]